MIAFCEESEFSSLHPRLESLKTVRGFSSWDKNGTDYCSIPI